MARLEYPQDLMAKLIFWWFWDKIKIEKQLIIF
jgi:hypothetical protein